MSRFHNYSFWEHPRNRTATLDGHESSRDVRMEPACPPREEGGKGIRILAPIIGIKRKRDEEAEKDFTKQNTRVLVGLRNACSMWSRPKGSSPLPCAKSMAM
jgi:hypothetical protein